MQVTVGDAGWVNESWQQAREGRRYAFFRVDTKHNKVKSEAAGRPIYDEVILLEQVIPGNNLMKPVRPMREEDKTEFAHEWAAFCNNREQQMAGTPLEHAPFLSRTQVAEFKALNIYTVEQLATLPDSSSRNIMGFHEVRTKAEAFLRSGEITARAKELERIKSENEAMIERQRAENEELRSRLAALEAQIGAPKRRGRPPKAKQE